MTSAEMDILHEHADPLVRKLALDHGSLWDAAMDYRYRVERYGPDDETSYEQFDALVKVMDQQPCGPNASARDAREWLANGLARRLRGADFSKVFFLTGAVGTLRPDEQQLAALIRSVL